MRNERIPRQDIFRERSPRFSGFRTRRHQSACPVESGLAQRKSTRKIEGDPLLISPPPPACWRREETVKEEQTKGKSGGGIMCIAAWVWQDHPLYPFLLVLNRDEFHGRPTKPVGWWGEGSQKILGGRDGVAGGTWLGCTRNGRLAFLTNVLEPDNIPAAKSRGDLPVKFLECGKCPLDFAEEVANEADKYNGFNLMLADHCSKTMVYVSNRPNGEPVSIELVTPGLHVLTNAGLDTPWHKALRLGKGFKEVLCKYGEKEIPATEMVEKLMRDRVKADRDCLPNTGCDPSWELDLSPVFVEVDTQLGRYGTRSTAVVAVKTNGEVSFYETYLEMNVWKEHTVRYQIGRQMMALSCAYE